MPVAALVLAACLLAAHLLLSRTLWEDFRSVRARLPTIGGVLFFLAMAAYPLWTLLLGLDQGHIDCLGRRCDGRIYDRAREPAMFWLGLALRFAFSAIFVSFALRASSILLRTWHSLPNRLPWASVSGSGLRQRLASLEREREEAVADGLRHRKGADTVLSKLLANASQRAQLQAEIDRRDLQWKQHRVLVLGIGFLVFVLVGAALVAWLVRVAP